MQREILFRGKRASNNKWVDGNLFQVGETCFILISTDRAFDYPEKVLVNAETVEIKNDSGNWVKINEVKIG